MKRLLNSRYLLLIASFLSFQACSNTYSAKPIEAWVVDAETKQPLEGVIVAAQWQLRYGWEGGGAYPLTVMEAVTDKNGRFYFPAWGPKSIPEHLPSEARLKDWDPAMVLYKKDYTYLMLTNDRPIRSMSGHGSLTRTSEWDGKTISLAKFRGPLEAYELNVILFTSFVDSIVRDTRDCIWALAPRLIGALAEEEQRFIGKGLRRFADSNIDLEDLRLRAPCDDGSSPKGVKR